MQDPRAPRWDDIRIFLAIHRQHSLGGAAGRLGLDISTVSRRLAALEADLGARLFERTREGATPTRAAERVLAAAEAMEAALGRLARDASDREVRAEGIVRLSAAPGMADVFVAPALVRLRARHPGLALELDASEQARDLTRHEADLALRSLRPRGAELVVTKLGTARWIPVAAPALVDELGRLSAWSDAPWITWDRDLATFPPARWVAQHAGKATIALRTSHFGSQLAALESGLGVALVPELYLAMRKLTAVRHTRALAASIAACPSDDLWLVCHRLLRDVPRIAAVWAFFADELRALGRRAR